MDFSQYYDSNTKILSMPEHNFVLPSGGLGNYLFNKMIEHGNKVAQIDSTSGLKDTYKSFLRRCVRTAIEMRSRGIKKGDIISFCTHNHLNSAVPYVATLFLGATTAALDPNFSKDDIKHLVDLVKPKMIFISNDAKKQITESEIKSEVIVFEESFFEFITEKENENEFKPTYIEDNKDTAIIIFSSGSTGLPKGICLSHKYFLFHCHNSPYPVCVGYPSMYWISTTYFILGAIITGFSKLIVNKFKADILWKYLQEYDVEYLFLSPSDAIEFYKARPKTVEIILKCFVLGGSFVSPNYLIKYKKMLPETEVIYGYGQTEIFGGFNALVIENDGRKLGSIGTPMRGRSYKIVDPETEKPLGFNQTGELRVKTEWGMNGYHNMNSSTVYDEDGFFKTGDVVYYDEDFYFYIVDRVKEMFKFRGWHIIPTKLEFILMKHPDVQLAVVVGIPHPEDDNHILAIVKLVENSNMTENQLKKFVEDQVDDIHKLREGLIFVKDLCFTMTGKVKRRDLRELYVQGKLK